MRTILRTALIGIVVLAPAASCSSEDSDDATTTSTESSTTSQQVVAPIIVDGPEQLSVEVGAALDIVTDGVTEVSSSDERVLEVSQPSTDGSAEFNAGARALVGGEATLTVSGEDGELYSVEVEVR